jgi:uncharacterized protein YihD (DUF1040 family)
MSIDPEHYWKRPKRRDPRRIDGVLKRVREIWVANPDLRLMQLLLNPFGPNEDPFHIEESELLRRLELYRPSDEMK